jgi:hypothetical protein
MESRIAKLGEIACEIFQNQNGGIISSIEENATKGTEYFQLCVNYMTSKDKVSTEVEGLMKKCEEIIVKQKVNVAKLNELISKSTSIEGFIEIWQKCYK